MNAIAKYSAVFGRSPAVIREPNSKWGISVCMFPAMKPSFWRSLISEARDQTVYITAGLSAHPTSLTHARRGAAPRYELVAFTEAPIAGGERGTEDVPTAILQMIANYILDTQIPIELGHTLDFQHRLAPNTEMTAVLFAAPVGVDIKRIRRCTEAREILNVVPMTAPEVSFARTHGVGALLDEFERASVFPVFDYLRRSAL
jgi:hypothetical protein